MLILKLDFTKYQGTGNDFIIIDDRNHLFPDTDTQLIAKLCDRRFGVGADGLMLLREKEGYDFEMVYFNADGKTSSMCGNGGRCLVAFAKQLNLFDESCRFLAIDGEHIAKIEADKVALKMNDVKQVEKGADYYFLDTGSPHYVQYVENVDELDLIEQAHAIRYNDRYKEKGTNVNYVHLADQKVVVRTYERGVEDETFSCGTGVTAVAITHALLNNINQGTCNLQTKGGDLAVTYESDGTIFSNIWLIGPAKKVFEGVINV